MRKRSNQPFFWLLFGAGGMLSALTGAALVALTGLAGPLGLGVSPRLFDYAHALAFARSLPGKAVILAVIALFLWHAAHRIFHSLHDVGIHNGLVAKVATYGGALAITLIAALSLLSLGF